MIIDFESEYRILLTSVEQLTFVVCDLVAYVFLNRDLFVVM